MYTLVLTAEREGLGGCEVVIAQWSQHQRLKLDDAVAKPPPRKKARKEGTQRKGKGKENKTAQSKRKANKQGRIPLVGAQPQDQSKLPGTLTDSLNEQRQSQDQASTSADHPKEHT